MLFSGVAFVAAQVSFAQNIDELLDEVETTQSEELQAEATEEALPEGTEENAESEATAEAPTEEAKEPKFVPVLQGNIAAPVQEDKVDATISLTENLNKSGEGAISTSSSSPKKKPGDLDSNNWIDKLILANEKDDIKPDTLSGMVESSKIEFVNTRSNASVFDISGVMLRMTLKQAEDILQKRGYKKVSQKLEIPNFIKWRNEELCRGSGVIGYERLASCVVEKAKKEKYQYVESAIYAKYDTKENITINLTSNFTNNKIYKVAYKSEASSMRGNSQKATYLRNIKVFDFWKKVNRKYGTPDNKEEVSWGMGGNKPYLKARTGYLLLEDPMLRELDYTRMSREDQAFMNTNLYNF